MPFTTLKLHPSLLKGIKELGFHPAHAHSGRCHSAGAGRPGRARLRHDRQRQDRRVPAPDPAPAHGEAPRHHAGTGDHAHPRAGRADPGRHQRSRGPHADQRRRGVRRRRHGAAGARLPERRGRHHRHAGPAARSFPVSLRQAGGPPVPGARRSGPDARHGIPSRHPPGVAASSSPPPDALLQRHDARADHDADPGDAARPGHHQPGAQIGARGRDHPGGVSGAPRN